MLLQTKYKWHKKVLSLIVAIGGILLVLIGWYFIRNYFLQRDINKLALQINEAEKQLQQEKTNPIYKTYLAGDFIYSQDKHINYVALYKYLIQVKNYILHDLQNYTISRLILAIKPNQIIIDTTLPNYNVIYSSGGLIDLLSTRPFVKNIEANEFRKLINGINVKLNIETK